ncbi:transport-energizing ATPase, TRC40/GET3/ArsA family [Rubrobacter radiotolerans]|uniref:ArsA family ATPase n=1 Tax=Rubrobacter radiotolerans TaxID=42256 RepID=A0A023X6N8_RUBRA|nr:ArsA family ATPase [Rubrobacter radiotolerans]AHY47670.1 transport-energizing ATPase, TRC40/GET3/ArsA family [Rubrobacter radiotolerans]MDX5895073.1 ArsA family ATPase [Rubrobacter radiotolerans]SMC07395.1 arsenite-transporting ATPase [Rubrobacter radiotolerans DSM 5868]
MTEEREERPASGLRRLVFLGGKGGVGKTTLAAAYATMLAARGERTLLVSTDPAHSTSDVLGVRLTGEPTEVETGLSAVEIDAAADAARYVEGIKRDSKESVSPEVLPTIERHLDLAKGSPGTEESALFERFVDLISLCPAEYDRIVFDTAPTGHTLRLLALPALLSVWVEGMVRQREKVAGMERMLRNLAGRDEPAGDPVLERLRERRQRFHHARHRLLEDTTFYLVTVPERLPIEETERALSTLTAGGVHVGALLVNRVLPERAAEGDFMRARLDQQREYLREIERRFTGYRTVRIEQDARDVTSRSQLREIAARLKDAGLG